MRFKPLRLYLIIAALMVAGLTATAFWFEPQSLSIKVLEVETPAWSKETAPLRAVLISDIHIDNMHMRPERVAKIVERVNGLKPDIILLAGDYVGGHVPRTQRKAEQNARIEAGIARLGALKAPLGVYAVMGNHDCWWSCEGVREAFGAAGINFLENRSARIVRAGSDLWIVGVEDKWTQNPSIERATAGMPSSAATLMVEHNPDLFDWPDNHVPIMLAGHTHGGQVRLPFIGAVVRVSRHAEETAETGFTIDKDRILIVTRGLGESGPPARFGAVPQIMLLTIKPGTKAAVREAAAF